MDGKAQAQIERPTPGSCAFRVLVLAAGFLLFAFGLMLLWNSRDMWRTRAAVARWVKGYNGCMCADCCSGILGITPPFYGCCGTGRRADAQACGTCLTLGSGLLMVGGPAWSALARAGTKHWGGRACPSCGYSRDGLPVACPCPECGANMPEDAASA